MNIGAPVSKAKVSSITSKQSSLKQLLSILGPAPAAEPSIQVFGGRRWQQVPVTTNEHREVYGHIIDVVFNALAPYPDEAPNQFEERLYHGLLSGPVFSLIAVSMVPEGGTWSLETARETHEFTRKLTDPDDLRKLQEKARGFAIGLVLLTMPNCKVKLQNDHSDTGSDRCARVGHLLSKVLAWGKRGLKWRTNLMFG